MTRLKEKLYVTVPSLFRCPISMDVMRSPVILSTGVTYDRSSIQHWLDSGHDTCPVTMQVLPSKDFIPNRTLHRLWLLSGEPSSPDSRTSDEPLSPASRPSGDRLRDLIQGIQTGTEDLAISLSKIAEFAKISGENRRLLVTFPGFDSAIVRSLAGSSSRIDASEKVISVLDSVFREKGNAHDAGERIRRLILDSREECFSSFISVLRNGSPESKVVTVRVLEFLAYDFQSKRSIAETQDLLSLLMSLLKEEKCEELNDAVLSLLAIVSVTQSVKVELVRSGLVELLSKMLRTPTCGGSTVERCLRLLALAATCAEGRAAMVEEPSCAVAVMERMAKAAKGAAEDAVAVLWSLCCLCGNVKVRDDVAKRNGVAVILLVMQRGWEEHVRSMCVDLIKVLKGSCQNGFPLALGSYDTKTTHIKPC